MAYDYTQKKISVFTDINDVPRLASATQAENGSDHTERINTICDNLVTDFAALETANANQDTTIANIQTQVNALKATGVTSTTFNITINGTWFNSPSTVYMLLIYVPFEINLFEQNGSDIEVRDLWFGEFGNSSLNNNQVDAFTRENDCMVWTINNFSSPIDLGNFVDRWGRGWYIFVPFNEVSAGYGTDYFLRDNSNPLTITIDSLDRDVVEVFDLNIWSRGFIPINLGLATNSPLDDNQYYQALRIYDTKFNGSITINDVE